MFSRIAVIVAWLRHVTASRSDLLIENLALRQQLAILTAKRPRPRMQAVDRFFWLTLRRFWPRWKDALVVIRDSSACIIATSGAKRPDGLSGGSAFAVPSTGLVRRNDRGRTD